MFGFLTALSAGEETDPGSMQTACAGGQEGRWTEDFKEQQLF